LAVVFIKVISGVVMILTIDFSSINHAINFIANTQHIRERERERERESRGKRLRREITLKSNFRVKLIWVRWVNFNLGGFFFLFGLG
jgi:hypothetical protein